MEGDKMKRILAAATACLFLQFHVASAQAGTVLAKIDLRSQTMTVSEDGVLKYRWKVSTARKGLCDADRFLYGEMAVARSPLQEI